MGKSIILIDDDEIEVLINRRLLETTIMVESITEFYNGLEAITYLKILSETNTPPDLIFVDLNMPVMDGFGFLRELNKLPSHFRNVIKVIILTSSVTEGDYSRAKELGCEMYITKPLTKEKILQEVLNNG